MTSRQARKVTAMRAGYVVAEQAREVERLASVAARMRWTLGPTACSATAVWAVATPVEHVAQCSEQVQLGWRARRRSGSSGAGSLLARRATEASREHAATAEGDRDFAQR